MTRFQIVVFNRLDCEIARHDLQTDTMGYPRIARAIDLDADLRATFKILQPGDKVLFIDNEA